MFERAVAQQLDATYVLIQRAVPLDRAPVFASGNCADRSARDLDVSVGEGEHLFI